MHISTSCQGHFDAATSIIRRVKVTYLEDDGVLACPGLKPLEGVLGKGGKNG